MKISLPACCAKDVFHQGLDIERKLSPRMQTVAQHADCECVSDDLALVMPGICVAISGRADLNSRRRKSQEDCRVPQA
jgi:hypothetical protein